MDSDFNLDITLSIIEAIIYLSYRYKNNEQKNPIAISKRLRNFKLLDFCLNGILF